MLRSLGRATRTARAKQRIKEQIPKQVVKFVFEECKNPEGQQIQLQPWHYSYWQWLKANQIKERNVTGCAQIGKTLFVWLSCYSDFIEGGYSLAWVYPTQPARQKLVREHHKRLKDQFGFLPKLITSDTLDLFQYGGASINFVEVRSPSRNEGGAATKKFGFSAAKIFVEEASQYNLGELETLNNRLDASPIPSQPIIRLGTPGCGGGVEVYIDRCHYQFYPYCECPSCNSEIELSPKGCLLLPMEKISNSGSKIKVFLGESGRPVEWFHKDGSDPVHSAYFGCPHCEKEIPKAIRVSESYFKCKQTGILLTDYLETIKTIEVESKSSSIELSPLLRDTAFNLAEQIIKDGLTTSNTDNWQQQKLGLPSETTTSQLTPAIIKKAIAAPVPEKQPDFILCGIDQGRAEHWMVIIAFYLPEGWELFTVWEMSDRTIREVLWCGDINEQEIEPILHKYQVDYGLIDADPERKYAAQLSQTTGVVELAKRANTQPKKEYAEIIIEQGGIEHKSWLLDSNIFFKAVKQNFLLQEENFPLYRLPESWEKWIENTSERSPIKHLCSISYDPITEKWIRPPDHIDDIYLAFHFCEAAFALYLREHTNQMISDRAFS